MIAPLAADLPAAQTPRAVGLKVDERVEMPALRRASLTGPNAPAAPRAATPVQDATSPEVTGSGRLTVSLVSEGDAPALVKIRRQEGDTTLVSVLVAPRAPREIHLDGGAYQMMVRMPLGGTMHYFKGSPFSLPEGVDGNVVLTFKPSVVSGLGSSLQEISASEFSR